MADLPSDKNAAPSTPPMDAGAQALSEALQSSFAIVKFVMGLLVIVFLVSGVFIVGPQERAIVLRFGKPSAEGNRALLGPGFHWALPYPIDECVKVPISGIQKVTSTAGWFAISPTDEAAGNEPFAGPSLNPAVDGYLLTADGNIVHSRATLNYHIEDPIAYVFNFVNASNSVQRAVDNALVYTASRFPVDDILTRDTAGYREAVRQRVTELVAEEKLGVVIEQCDVSSRPPLKLKDDFANVLKAEITSGKVLNDARSGANQILSKAEAEAKTRINLAQSEKARNIAEITSRAGQFQELLPKFKENPELFAQQRLTETLGRVLTNATDKFFIAPGMDGKTRELRLNLNREPPKIRAEEPK